MHDEPIPFTEPMCRLVGRHTARSLLLTRSVGQTYLPEDDGEGQRRETNLPVGAFLALYR